MEKVYVLEMYIISKFDNFQMQNHPAINIHLKEYEGLRVLRVFDFSNLLRMSWLKNSLFQLFIAQKIHLWKFESLKCYIIDRISLTMQTLLEPTH